MSRPDKERLLSWLSALIEYVKADDVEIGGDGNGLMTNGISETGRKRAIKMPKSGRRVYSMYLVTQETHEEKKA